MSDPDPWFGVELRHLTALAAVAREGSFRGAADSLGYVQSAVSQQIAQLERLVGVRLVDRAKGSKQIRVTAPGELLVDHAEGILARVQAARVDLADHCAPDGQGTVKVGVFPGVSAGLLPRVLRDFAAAQPAVRVEPVESANDAAMFDFVEQAKVDVAFCELPLQPGPFASQTVLRDGCVLLVAADSDLAGRPEPPTVEELAQTPLVMPDGVRSSSTLETWFHTQGVTPTIALRTSHHATLRAFVAAGLGAAIVPSAEAQHHNRTIHAIDLDGIVPDRHIAVFWRSDRPYQGALQAFCHTAIQTGQSLRGGDHPPFELIAA
jgi:DNA-binding transcriptional LysR family regulator